VRRSGGVSRIVRDTYSNDSKSWWSVSAEVRKRDNNKCVQCDGSGKIEVHHIVPISRGGVTTLSNLISLCETCHAKRHSHMFTRLVKR